MTTIPPTAAQTLLTVAAAAQAPTVIVPRPPADLARLPPGSVIEVEVVAPADAEAAKDDASPPRPANTAVVRTPAGDVPVRVSVPVDPGVKLTLEVVRANANQVSAKVVAVDGDPIILDRGARPAAPEAPAAKDAPMPQRPVAPAPVLPPAHAWTPSGAMPLVQITPLSAVVIAAPATAPFPVGAELAIRIVAVETAPDPVLRPAAAAASPPLATSPPAAGVVAPAVPTGPAPVLGPTIPPVATSPLATGMVASPASGPPASGPPAAPGGAPFLTGPSTIAPATQAPFLTAPGPPAVPPAPGLGLQVPGGPPISPAPVAFDPAEIKLPGPQGLPPAAPTPPSTVQPAPVLAVLTGKVVSLTATGAPIVHTEAGDIQVNVRANLIVGATVTLDVAAGPPQRAAAAVSAFAGGPLALPLPPGGGWPSLSEALTLLQRVDPQAAANLAAALPDGGPRTALAMMSFLHALRSGDPRAWPGDAALRGLERAGPRGAQLAAQISGEVGELARRAGADGGEWRTLPLPWNLDGKIDRIALITRRQEADDGDAQKKKPKGGGTRFVINLSLSRLGDMQLDGMFRKQARSFDLMIRTKQPVPDDLARELPGRFAEINAAMGLTGALTFQVVRRFPDPTAAPGDGARPGVWA
jgi:hypothetical protein